MPPLWFVVARLALGADLPVRVAAGDRTARHADARGLAGDRFGVGVPDVAVHGADHHRHPVHSGRAVRDPRLYLAAVGAAGGGAALRREADALETARHGCWGSPAWSCCSIPPASTGRTATCCWATSCCCSAPACGRSRSCIRAAIRWHLSPLQLAPIQMALLIVPVCVRRMGARRAVPRGLVMAIDRDAACIMDRSPPHSPSGLR